MRYFFIALILLLSTNVFAYKPNTVVTIQGDKFYINGSPTFEGKTWRGYKIEGLLPNSRMVNGIFDDLNPQTQSNWVYADTNKWSADRNTSEFVAAMPSWREHGLLAITLGLQGGSPFGYSREQPWINSAYKPDGSLRTDFMKRAATIVEKADKLGMVVILQLFYWGQDERLQDEKAVKNAVKNTINWIEKRGYKNILIELCNECDNKFDHNILKPARVAELIRYVQSRGFMASVSFNGRVVPPADIIDVSDFILLHGNGAKTVDVIEEQIQKTKALMGGISKPILYNEDDHFDFDKPVNHFVVATANYISWGYFDYRFKGEPFEEGFQSMPCDWRIGSERKRGFFEILKEWTK